MEISVKAENCEVILGMVRLVHTTMRGMVRSGSVGLNTCV